MIKNAIAMIILCLYTISNIREHYKTYLIIFIIIIVVIDQLMNSDFTVLFLYLYK